MFHKNYFKQYVTVMVSLPHTVIVIRAADKLQIYASRLRVHNLISKLVVILASEVGWDFS